VYAGTSNAKTVGSQVVLLAAIVAAAAGIGLVAQALGTIAERLALAADWRRWPSWWSAVARQQVERRQRRWDVAHAAWHTAYLQQRSPDAAVRPSSATRHRTARARDRIAVERPERPTWSGDRLHAVTIRLHRDHHLDLAVVWPHMWLVIPDQVRLEITEARLALSRATTLAAWALLYAPFLFWWWPAALVAGALMAAARYRIRVATDSYATLLEATSRLHATTLAGRLGIEHSGPADPNLGHAITRHLRTRLPSPRQSRETGPELSRADEVQLG
jgi:hypothetical protein